MWFRMQRAYVGLVSREKGIKLPWAVIKLYAAVFTSAQKGLHLRVRLSQRAGPPNTVVALDPYLRVGRILHPQANTATEWE